MHPTYKRIFKGANPLVCVTKVVPEKKSLQNRCIGKLDKKKTGKKKVIKRKDVNEENSVRTRKGDEAISRTAWLIREQWIVCLGSSRPAINPENNSFCRIRIDATTARQGVTGAWNSWVRRLGKY
jgi:hypothetical protein